MIIEGDIVRITGKESYCHCFDVGQVGIVIEVDNDTDDTPSADGYNYSKVAVQVRCDGMVQWVDANEVEVM